ncbi:MAG TPA: hypothetical protein VK157_02605 [Phycisphaerales bacterium]|nr:hypothetical protein [Phycisphaerales bacterium]
MIVFVLRDCRTACVRIARNPCLGTRGPLIMGYFSEGLPPRVRTALEVLEHCRVQLAGDCCSISQQKELTPAQAAMQRQAHQVLTLYLAGEMDYGDQPPKSPNPPDEDTGTAAPVCV